MQFVRHRPAAPLDRHVECFWWSRREIPQSHWEYMLPSGRAQLVIALHETPIVCLPGSSGSPIEWSGSVVHGPQWRYYAAGPKPCGVVVGVSFRPGAASAVLGVPAMALADQHLSLSTLWGRRGQLLHEQMMEAAEPMAVFRILELALNERIERPLLMHPAIAHALTFRWSIGITHIQRDAGYSPKHFIALFRAGVGLTPKHYFRIQRFNEALRRLAAEPGTGLADVAATVGYSDQAHMAREFRELAGITPRQYRPTTRDSALHHRATNPFTGIKLR